jgi:hypothetical protein
VVVAAAVVDSEDMVAAEAAAAAVVTAELVVVDTIAVAVVVTGLEVLDLSIHGNLALVLEAHCLDSHSKLDTLHPLN